MFDSLFESKYFGIGALIIGILYVRYMLKEDPNKYDKGSPLQGYISGWGAAILLILGGLISLWVSFHSD